MDTPYLMLMTGQEGTLYRILEGVAEAESTDIMELPPLGDTIDADAIQKLLDSTERVRVEFDYAGYAVLVTNTEVSVQEKQSTGPSKIED